MSEAFEVGDIVTRRSYNFDILFKICAILDKPVPTALLKGIDMRVEAHAPLDDLVKVTPDMMNKYTREMSMKCERYLRKCISISAARMRSAFRTMRADTFARPGRVLHIDSDEDYIDMCMGAYKRLGIDAVLKLIPENRQPDTVPTLVKDYLPDILVITGHDAMGKNKKNIADINNYRNSNYFVETVERVRRYIPSLDELVIFAGACQSNYEALLHAGANFASSPGRVMIHALDPVFICQKIAYTDINTIVQVKDVLDATITGAQGIGGVQTRGKYREGMPKGKY
jgi:spore coat assembly protein